MIYIVDSSKAWVSFAIGLRRDTVGKHLGDVHTRGYTRNPTDHHHTSATDSIVSLVRF